MLACFRIKSNLATLTLDAQLLSLPFWFLNLSDLPATQGCFEEQIRPEECLGVCL